MSVGRILTLGLGTFGGVEFLPTLGYSAGEAVADVPETGKGWPRSRKERRAEKRRQKLEAREETRFEGISAEVARFEQSKRIKAAEAPKPAVKETRQEKEVRVFQPEAVSGESVRLILEAWTRIEERQAQEVAQREIARIRAMKEEELMIVTMMAALA